MRRHIPVFLLIAVLLSPLQGCKPVDLVSNGIAFSPEVASTKGLLDAADLAQTGTRIQVYDYLTGFNGTVGNITVTDDQTVKYFSDQITYDGAAVWPYCNPSTGAPDATVVYPWTKTGTHSFFGWLVADGTDSGIAATDLFSGNQPAPFGFNESTRVLSIPETTMDEDSPQFDFSYSGVNSIAAASHVTGQAVPLQLHHMFTALNFNLNNTSGNTIILKSVTLTGLKNNRSASINFSSETPVVTTTVSSAAPSSDVAMFTSSDPDGDVFIHEDREKNLTDFVLMWPHSYVELNGAQIVVVYKIRDTHDVVTDDLTASIVLDRQNMFRTNSTGMEAGKKYSFLLQFKKSTLDIYTRVLPWDYEEFDWDYSDHSISARSGMFKDGVLAFYRFNAQDNDYTTPPTTDEWSAKTMRFSTRSEVLKGRFYIEAPTEGRWQVTVSPMSAAQYFIVTPTSGDIDVNTDNGKAEFSVSVNPELSPSSTQTLYFSVAIYFNGDWHDANSEFNRKNIKLVLDAN